jgi:hypothetical protein
MVGVSAHRALFETSDSKDAAQVFQFGPESGLADPPSSGHNNMRNRGPHRQQQQPPRTPQTPTRVLRNDNKQPLSAVTMPRADSNLNLRAMLEQGADWVQENPMPAAVATMLLVLMILLAQTI